MLKPKKVLGCLGILAAIVALANVGLWLSGHKEAAFVMFVGVAILASFIAASGWSALLLRAGAELAIRSQESDDKRDIAQIKAATDLVKVLMRQEEKEQEQQPKFPLPDQQQGWLPKLTEFTEGEFEEVGRD